MPPDLLDAVLAAPDDDSPRLVLADWLDENGDPARAEFIRTQIAIVQFPKRIPGEFDRDELSLLAREKTLLHKHGENWLAPLRARGEPLHNRSSHGQFVRGFVQIVWMTAATFLKRGEALFRRTPMKELRVTRATQQEFESLILWDVTARLNTLDLSGRHLGDRGASQLGDAEEMASVRRLRLQRCGIGDAGASDLANCWFDWPLDELDISGNPVQGIGLTRLRERFGNAVIFNAG